MYKVTEEPYQHPLDVAQASVETFNMPDGTPAPTGYYPNLNGYMGRVIQGSPTFPEMYPEVLITEQHAAEEVAQHPYLYVEATWTPPADNPRPSGISDPLAAGPPQPTIRDLSMFYAREQGSSHTRFDDVPGHKFPKYGNQDGVSTTYFQDTGLAMAPYNPSLVVAEGTQPDGITGMPDTLRAVAPSPAHGWSEQPVIQTAQEDSNNRMASQTQQQPGRQDFLANSNIAGQSYGLQTVHVAQTQQAGEVYSVRRRV